MERKPANEKERLVIKDYQKAFALKEFITPSDMTQSIKHSGFVKIHEKDVLYKVVPSVKYLYNFAQTLNPIAILLNLIPNRYLQAGKRNVTALLREGEALERDLFAYFLHSAEKPG